jgi:hypothetical protein
MKIRQGNDFIFLWTIVRNGIPEDLDNAKNIKLHFKNFDRVSEVRSFQIVDGNIVRVEVTPEWASRLGAYRLILSYKFEDQSYSDGDRKCVVDVLAFNIVPKTSEADDLTEVSKTTDIMIGFFGLSAYEVWLKDNPDKTIEDYYNWLRQPATDAAESLSTLEQTVSGNEALRVTAEQGRSDAELLRVGAEGIRDANETDRINAEGIRDANETDRINAERDRVDAEDLRELAETARETAEGLRQTNTATAIQQAGTATTAANTAAGEANSAATAANTAAGAANNAAEAANTAAGAANNAATAANTAAQNADNARLAIQDDLALKANHGYESNPKTLKEVEDDTINTTEKPTAQSLSELNARITALEAIISNKIKDRIDVTKEFNVWGKTNLILYGDGASTKTPDFIGQTYIDTTNGYVYIAVGVSNAGNWKLV